MTGRTVNRALHAAERDRLDVAEERAAFVAGQRALDGRRLVFPDETGSNVAMTRRYARPQRGHPAYGSVPHRRGKNLTAVGAISATGGLVAWRAMDGAMTGARFLAFVVEALVPALSGGTCS